MAFATKQSLKTTVGTLVNTWAVSGATDSLRFCHVPLKNGIMRPHFQILSGSTVSTDCI